MPIRMTERREMFLMLAVVGIGLGGCSSNESDEEARVARSGAACGEDEFGADVGDLARDFALEDQHGDTILLSDYCGKVVYIQFAAMWCPTCRAEAAKIQGYLSDHEADGLVILNLIAETTEFEPPTRSDLETWAVTFDIESPVMADPEWKIWDRYFEAHVTPRAMLLDRQGRIVLKDFVVPEEELAGALE